MNPTVKYDFEGNLTIHGGHFSIDAAEQITADQGYREEHEHISEVSHKWATWGRLPADFDQDDITHGWWIVNPNSGYKHIKRVTYIKFN